jgi:ABC-type antimicrobial peptide transport system permease subunit
LAGGLPTTNEELADKRPLGNHLKPTLADCGMAVKHVKLTFGEGEKAETIYDYFSVSSDRMLLDSADSSVVLKAFEHDGPQEVFTYLANRIEKVTGDGAANGDETKSRRIPYSTITALGIAHGGSFSEELYQQFWLPEDEIILTSWAADDLKAQVGDRIRVIYFEPETTHGEPREKSVEFRLKAIAPLTEPKSGFTRRAPAVFDQRPTIFNDPDLTPEVKGITDQASISDWDAPFPFDYKLIRSQDDTYWENHRTTPKAYISMAKAQQLWSSRFGSVTNIRIPAHEGFTKESVEQRILDEAERQGQRFGLDFIPVKQQGLAAASGTTPFDVLFLLLSMFIIAAAIVLVWLLFRLGVEQRAAEIGLLLALGWTRPKVRNLLVLEGTIVAACGALIGAIGGVGYAWLMLVGLRTWWVGAIATPFLTLYVTPRSLLIGFFLGVVVSVLTTWFALGKVKRAVVRTLLNGEIRTSDNRNGSRGAASKWIQLLAVVLFVAAIILVLLAAQLGGEMQAVALLGAGAALLVALVLLVIAQFQSAGRRIALLGNPALVRLAVRNAARHVGRSAATIALVASAAFLIVAVSAFRASPTTQGIGGFDLLAESSQPIYEDLNAAGGREKLLADKAPALEGSTVLALRVKPGDDASCRNLYQPTQPQVLGVPQAMIDYFKKARPDERFAWSASAAKSSEEQKNPWQLLSFWTPKNQPVAVVLDQNTAMYSLRLYRGIGETFDVTYPDGRTIHFRVAGLLSNSVLQGSLLIGEGDFKRLFPQISGYRFFLIRSAPGKASELSGVLEDKLGDEGFDVVDSRGRLADLLAVQNTYISTFQSLGALGLVLGTFGLAAVQLRSVFERRKELALMRASGFRRMRLGEMVLVENLFLLVSGLVLGTLAALVSLVPQMVFGAAHVPLMDLTVLLGVVLVVGVATGMISVWATLHAPLVGALRGE